jgi:hypothetical protein
MARVKATPKRHIPRGHVPKKILASQNALTFK